MVSDQKSIDDIIRQAKSSDQTAPLEESKAEVKIERLAPNKIIDRLDAVTIQSEAEASKVVDLIDDIMARLSNTEGVNKELKELILNKSGDDDAMVKMSDEVTSSLVEVQEMLFNTMNLLQYQDVLRQKIEKIATALTVFYDYLGEFLGHGIHKAEDRAVGKHVEDSSLARDQKTTEINEIIRDIKSSGS